MAVSDTLEDAIVQRIDSLSLSLGATACVVQRKKAPKIERALETTPLIQVTSSVIPGRCEWWDTGTASTPAGRKKLVYLVEVTMSAPGDRDPTADQDTYRDWRQAITRAFEPPSVLGVDELYTIDVDPGTQYDREGFPRNYDQSRIVLECITIETAA